MDAANPRRAREPGGMPKSSFYRAADAGRYDRIARGLYLPADAPAADWDWLEAAARHSRATICLTSALAHYDLTDEVPRALHVAIPRGSRRPASTAAIAWHLFDADTFDLGRGEIEIPGATLSIGLYSPQRCIVDAFRLRGDLGYELGRDALREWLRRGGKPSELLELADQLPRAMTPLRQTLEAIG